MNNAISRLIRRKGTMVNLKWYDRIGNDITLDPSTGSYIGGSVVERNEVIKASVYIVPGTSVERKYAEIAEGDCILDIDPTVTIQGREGLTFEINGKQWQQKKIDGKLPDSWDSMAGGIMKEVEYPRTSIAGADASSFYSDSYSSWPPANAINGITTDSFESGTGWHSAIGEQPSWIRINLGATHRISKIKYWPRANHLDGTFLDYEIYVTDCGSSNVMFWGYPVSTGTWSWSPTETFKELSFTPAMGRFVVFRCIRGADNCASAMEVGCSRTVGSLPQMRTILLEPKT